MKRSIICIFALASLIYINPVSAEIKVLSVKGSVAYKTGQKWETLRVLMKLTPGTKISTGVNSSAVLQIDKHTVTVNPMTMIKIYESQEKVKIATEKGKEFTSNTKIGLKRGSIHAKVFKEHNVKTVFKVSTPVATSSVRGTEELISYGPNQGMVIKILEGSAKGDNANGSSKYLSPGLSYQQKPGSPDPASLLSDTEKKALASIFMNGLTSDESNAFGFSGENYIDTPENPDKIQDSKINTNVNLFILWK